MASGSLRSARATRDSSWDSLFALGPTVKAVRDGDGPGGDELIVFTILHGADRFKRLERGPQGIQIDADQKKRGALKCRRIRNRIRPPQIVLAIAIAHFHA